MNQIEWRIFDPSHETDTLFLSLPGDFQGIRWDTTFDNAYFSSGDSVFSVQWRLGAKPRFITRLPTLPGTDYEHWWFDPDSGSWQSLRVLGWWTTNNPYVSRFEGELWESTPHGGPWRRVRADSVDLIDEAKDLWQWSDGSRLPGRALSISLDDLESEAWEETWGGRTAFIDTSTFAITRDDGAGYDSDQWFFLGLESTPRRGVAFQLAGSLAPESDKIGVLGPIYFVDLDRRTQTLVDNTDVGIMISLVAEHCGFLLIRDNAGNLLVMDSSGRRVFSPPSTSDGAVWVPLPRE